MSKEKHKLEDIIRELRSLLENHSRNGTGKAKERMVQLKRMGFTNVEISELGEGRWSASTVKSHTTRVKTDNPGPRDKAINLLTELVDLHLRLDDVKETNNTVKSLRDKGLKLENLLNYYKELQKYKINQKDLLNTYDKLQKTGIRIDKIKEILNYKTDLDKLGINQESIRQIHKASKKFGKPTEILEAINTYGELKIIKENLKTLNIEQDAKRKKLDELDNNIAELEKEENKIKESLELYRQLDDQGFTLEVLSQILAISKKYGNPKEVLKGLEKFGNLTNIQNEISKLNIEKSTGENDLKKMKLDTAYLKNAIEICMKLLYDYNYSISTIQTMEKVSEKYGGTHQVIEAIGKFENLKDIEKQIEEISTKKAGLESRVSELKRENESLRNKVDALTKTAAGALASISEKFTAETEKMTNKFNDGMTTLSLEIEVFQKNLTKAYGDSLKEIREKIPETAILIGEIDAKIKRSKNLSLIIDLMENPTELKEPVTKVFGSMITLTNGMETFTEIHKDKIEKSWNIKSCLSGLRTDLLEFKQDELRKTTTGNE